MVCENCGKEHNGLYGSGRFCCKKCARSYSTKNIKNKLKAAKCIDCDKLIYIHKRASAKTCRCDECKLIHSIPLNKCIVCGKENVIRSNTNSKIYKCDRCKSYSIKYCKICGSSFIPKSKNQTICKGDFCQTHNIQQFNSLIKYFGFDKNKIGTNEVEIEFNRVRNNLYKLYWEDHLSSSQICQIYNYPNVSNLVAKIFTYLGIPHKSPSENVKENYLYGRLKINTNNTTYKSIWHTTWDNQKVYLRSSYELDYAKFLDDHKINYEVETKRIKYWDSKTNEYRCAIPDFYLPGDNLIVEIKSSYTLDKQNMEDKMKAYLKLGYKFKLICDHKELKL